MNRSSLGFSVFNCVKELKCFDDCYSNKLKAELKKPKQRSAIWWKRQL